MRTYLICGPLLLICVTLSGFDAEVWEGVSTCLASEPSQPCLSPPRR